MKGNRLPFKALAIVLALASSGAAAQSQGSAHGRTVFDKKGCQSCHSYVSRRGAPSVRDMLREFEGEPVRVLNGIPAVKQHQDALSGGKVSNADLRLIAEWLGADLLPDSSESADSAPEVQQAAASPRESSPITEAPSTSVAPIGAAVPAAVANAATPVSRAPVPELSRPAKGAGPAISGLRIQSFGETGGDRLIVEMRGGEPEGVDMSTSGNQFVVSLSGVGLAGIPTHIPAGGAFKVIESVETRDDGHTVTITMVPRQTGWTYSGMQGRNRLVVDFSAEAKSAPSLVAAEASSAKSGGGSIAAGIAAVGVGATSAGAAAAVKSGKTVADSLPAKAVAEKPAVATPGDKKPDQSKALAGKGVEQKAAGKPAAEQKSAEQEQAKARELARKAEQARAEQAKAKEQAEAVARAKAAEEAARKQERAAEQAKVPSPVLAKAEPSVPPSATEAAGSKDARKLKKNRPYKEANLGPCPPPNPADQVIGVVDVERAKEIIDRIGCPQCHAYVQKKTGTPFREVLKKYKGDPACVIHRLKTNETHKDEGVTADIRGDEFKILADYVATRMK